MSQNILSFDVSNLKRKGNVTLSLPVNYNSTSQIISELTMTIIHKRSNYYR